MKKYIKIIVLLIIVFSLSQIFNTAYAITNEEEKNIVNEESKAIDETQEDEDDLPIDESENKEESDPAVEPEEQGKGEPAVEPEEQEQEKSEPEEDLSMDATEGNEEILSVDATQENKEVLLMDADKENEEEKDNSSTDEPVYTKTIEDGIYTIKTAVNEKFALDIYNNSKDNNANLELWSSNLQNNQKFNVKYLGDGSYSITALHSGKALDVKGAFKEPGTNVAQYSSNGDDNQKWFIKETENGYYNIISKCNGLYLDIPHSDAKNSANVQVWTGNGGKNQMFKFEKNEGLTIHDGTYTIKTAVNEKFALDIYNNSKDNNANLELWSSNLQNNQKFRVKYLGDGSYSITAIHSGKVLDVKGAFKAPGTNVAQYSNNGNDNQKWIIKDIGNGYYNIISKCNGLYLDIPHSEAKNSANVQVYTGNGGKNQMFKFEESSNKVIENGTYSIRNVADYRVLDVSGNSTSDGGNVIVWENKAGNNQQFKLNYLADGYYTITSSHSGKCLDVEGGSKKSGANVLQWGYKGNENQKWTIKSLGNGYYNIINKWNGLYLTQSSGNICVMNANNSNNQKFQFYNPNSLAKFSTGTYGKSGLKVKGDKRGTDLKYYKYGTGSNVFFATFCLHGFEDSWKKDGGELVKIADAFYEKLKANNDMSLANKWTIYIFPEVNPDGRNYGTTNNGPGRTTLYSADSKHKGIDLNRCWSTSFSAVTNNDRNYTGTKSFLAYEARDLRDFLLANKSKNGQTLLVDLHGWTQQLIGDSTIRGYYKKYFPENEDTPTYGKGYMINWARTNLGSKAKTAKSALIELPSYIKSSSDVTKYKLKDKYINATLNMLKGII